jgi:very-short-patch-repair endonuclease
MFFKYKNKLTNNAKSLRKEMTKEERRLWYEFLKNLPVTFYRQKMVGNYILDFYYAPSKIAIELDGSQHYEDEEIEYDKKRDDYLNSLGIKVLRYTNLQIHQNFKDVCNDILKYIDY